MEGIDANAKRVFHCFLLIGAALVLGAALVGSTGCDVWVLIVADEVEQGCSSR